MFDTLKTAFTASTAFPRDYYIPLPCRRAIWPGAGDARLADGSLHMLVQTNGRAGRAIDYPAHGGKPLPGHCACSGSLGHLVVDRDGDGWYDSTNRAPGVPCA